MIRICASVLLTLLLTGCSGGRYADFTLPTLERYGTQVRWSWDVLPAPVMGRGEKGTFDSVDALNPSVIRVGTEWWNFYSGYDGQTWHTGLAVASTDPAQWTRRGKVLSPDGGSSWEGDYIAANGTAMAAGEQGAIRYWYQAGRVPRIGLAGSSDGVNWKKRPAPVLDVGPRGSWDERGVADPYVFRPEGSDTLFMYYLGQDRARRQRIGVARSKDGVVWEKLRSNPILELGAPGEFDETGLGEPAVWQEQQSYWMLYTARDPKEFRRLGLARSQDGIHWERVTTKPVLGGDQPWNSAVVCDPTVDPFAGGTRVWFGGGNRPEPAENLNGQIGLAVLHLNVVN